MEWLVRVKSLFGLGIVPKEIPGRNPTSVSGDVEKESPVKPLAIHTS
jgi:hypothetical protein